MIVADSNLIAYLLIPGPNSTLADQLLRRDPDWCAPLLYRSELRNILALYIRTEGMTLAKGQQTMEKAETVFRNREHAVPSDDVLELASNHRVSAYDAEFIVLAKMLGVKLITFDQALRTMFPKIAIKPEAFA
jgi:predicted nucleic acid-binding protein